EQLLHDPRGGLWIMGDQGETGEMGLLRWQKDRFERVPGLPPGNLFDMAWVSADEVWMARRGALERYRWDGLSMTLRERVGAAQGLPPVSRGGIALGRNGQVWAT
ncbi:hypothetical protein, partial [Stenotrophomonas sp. SrG]|uniref:hypothetical protein n=1 Tax=Stenotrophomonas sp. SrG TaxID=3414430 RepID=UPI003CEBF1B4